jgi:hypothetical protein
MKLNIRRPRRVTVLFWSCWMFSIYFALVEIIVRNIGYPRDNTFVFLAIFSLIVSFFCLVEIHRPGYLKKLACGTGSDQ